jgi:hypothetical protein
MKYTLTFFMLLCAFSIFAQANSIDIGIFNTPAGSNKLEIRIKPNQNITPTQGGYTAGLFTIKFPTSYNTQLSLTSSTYAQATEIPPPPVITPNGTSGGYNYYIFSKASGSGGTFNANQEYVIAVIEVIGATSGTGTFEIANDSWTANNNGTYYQEYNGGEVNNIIYQTNAAAALPVELIAFKAVAKPNRSVQLSWVAESEQDLLHYEIEKSTDAQQFDVIGQAESKGEIGITAKYEFDDLQPASGDNYYRLKMINDDNTFEYSPIQKVRFEDNGITNFNIQPNPTYGPFTLLFNAEKEVEVNIVITGANGLLVKTQKFSAQKGKNAVFFNDTNLSAGQYNVTLEVPGQEKIVQQLMITRA